MATIDLAPPDGLSADERCRRIESEELPPTMAQLLFDAAAGREDQLLWNFFDEGVTATYGQALEQVTRAARAFSAWGVGKGTHVGIMLPNVPQLPVAWLALATLGAVMVPINVRYSARELRYVVEDGEVERLLIDASLVGLLGEGEGPSLMPAGTVRTVGERLIGYESWDAAVAEAEARLPALQPVERDDLINIQYTSGTTGFPKGCLLTQRYWLTIGKVAAARDGRRYRRILAPTPFTYMDPQWLLMMTLYQGASLYVARRQSASRFAGWLHQHRIEFCLFPEVVMKQPPSPLDGDNAMIRANVYGLRPQAQAELQRRFNLVARECYGMTEIGSGMYMPIEADDMVGSGSCGRPSPFRRFRIVDEQGNDVPEGERGELVVSGAGLFQGYYRKPEANKTGFFGEWFRTGDIFERDARGYYYIVGRIKDMVRRAGENISAREVEAVVRNMDEIADAAVLPVKDPQRGEEVKIYLVPQQGVRADDGLVQAVLAHCERELAAFKVPRYFEFIERLPRTTSEKIAKGELAKLKEDLRVGAYDRVEKLWR